MANYLICPKCAVVGGTVELDLTDRDRFHCGDCSEDFTRGDVDDVIAAAGQWAKVLAWVDQYPEEEPAETPAGAEKA